MATSLDGLATEFRTLAQRFGTSGARRLVEAGAQAGKTAALDTLIHDLPSKRLRNVGRRGTRLGAGYDLTGDATAEVKLRPRGAWVMLTKGARRHPIGVKRRRKGPPRRRLRMGGNWVTGPISHPGFMGHGTLTKALKRIEADVPAAVKKEVEKFLG